MMRQCLGLFSLAVFCGVGLCVADEPSEAVKKEQQALEGAWNVTSVEMPGKKVVMQDGKPSINGKVQAGLPPLPTLTWKDGKGIYNFGGKGRDLEVIIDPTQTPKTLDAMMEVPGKGEPRKVSVIKAIYQIDGDKMEICQAVPGNGGIDKMERPKEFKVSEESTMLTCERQKP
jgi:uncharacterized protein (TIGR03067 family)